jgi:site-specific DNA-adenine methylase
MEIKKQIENKIVPAMPYMGNKRKLATKILNAIYDTVGDFETLYDLFGGGGSVSVAGLLSGHKVIYNEYNTGIANLMKHIKDGGELPNKWITREEFNKHKDGDDWYSGFIKCVWSFGNQQKSYLFGKNIEDFKRLGHLISVNQDEDARKELSEKLGLSIPICKDRHEFRQFICKELKSRKGELQQLQQLERLEQLERLQQLERLERLEIYNKSYNELDINGGVIYCDPPYKGTAGYQKTINYDEFYRWCLENKNPVFISEYNMPDGFIEVAQFKHNTSLAQKSNNKVIEKLYWNGKKYGNNI